MELIASGGIQRNSQNSPKTPYLYYVRAGDSNSLGKARNEGTQPTKLKLRQKLCP